MSICLRTIVILILFANIYGAMAASWVINKLTPEQNYVLHEVSGYQQVSNTYMIYEFTDSLINAEMYDATKYTFKHRLLTLVELKNPSDSVHEFVLQSSELYIDEVGICNLSEHNGVIKNTNRSFPIENKHLVRIPVNPFSSEIIYILGRPFYFKDFPNTNYLLSNILAGRNYKQYPEKDRLLYVKQMKTEYILFGFMFLILCIITIMFFYTRDKIYGYYLLYVLFTLVYIFTIHEITMYALLVRYKMITGCFINELSQMAIVVSFISFYSHAFNLSDKKGFIHLVRQSTYFSSLGYIGLLVVLYSFEPGWIVPYFWYYFIRIILHAALIIFLFYALRQPRLLLYQKILLAGSFIFLACSLLSRLPFFFSNANTPYNGMVIMYIGIGLEMLFFSVALGVRVATTYSEAQKLKDKYILELESNDKYLQNEKIILEGKIEERVQVIAFQNSIIDKSKRELMLQQFEKEKAQIQMLALSSQMNPHFIFNCMNAIQNAILTNNNEKAAALLNDFAILIRMVLQNSVKVSISLSDEIDLLKQYLNLEQSRLPNAFEYEINVEDTLEEEFIQIPNLMIQPLIENAIWHGFKDINYKGKIIISFSLNTTNNLVCKVSDNGKGYKNDITKTTSLIKDKPMAIEIIRKRLDLLNKSLDNKASILITELDGELNNSTGTEVILTLPVIK